MAKIETLKDDLNDGSINTSLWNVSVVSGSSITETDTLNFVSKLFGNDTFRSDPIYTLGESSISFEPIDINITQVTFMLRNLSWLIRFRYLTGDLVMTIIDTQSFPTFLYSQTVTYNATTHKVLRIRETGGIIFFEGSTDGVTYTIYGQYSHSLPLNQEAQFVTEAYSTSGTGTLSLRYINHTYSVPQPKTKLRGKIKLKGKVKIR